ncbi:GbsR/MarR family transcriptional regulator [Nonomuraea sp. M3C6]|uniref:GbsR/MarR family transcriptional regulator n=1 Tax=Nonomuraea marmarensis TaxID=3351344 RepID=A0ABW7AKZ5_9ACTN
MPVAEASREELLIWVERIAKYCADQDNLPLIAGRILGWLVVCESPEQSADQIGAAIGASRASLSTNLRLLDSVGFLTQITKPGNRTVFYRLDDEAWERVVRRQIASMTVLGEIMNDGIRLVGEDPGRGARMRAARDVFSWMEQVFAEGPPPPSARRTAKEAQRW